MLVVRPAGPADYDALMTLAVLSGRGFTSLPEDEPTLRGRLETSAASFAGQGSPLEAWYSLMLEDSDINATRHARALVGGVLAGIIGRTDIFVSGGAEHQGPARGGPVAVIARVATEE